MQRNKSKKPFFLLIIFFIILPALGLGIFVLFFEGDKLSIDLQRTGDYIGTKGTIHYDVIDSKSGIRSVTVWGLQGNVRERLHSINFPRTAYTGIIGPQKTKQTFTFDTQKEGFSDGAMTITVEAVDFSMRRWFQGNKTIASKEITVDTVPPRIQILHSEKYISSGGTGIAIYQLSDKKSRHGVTVNGRLHPGFAVDDGRDDTYISFFGIPFDTKQLKSTTISAVDPAGNTAIVSFNPVFKEMAKKNDIINIGDNFLARKIPEFQQYYPTMQGEFIDKYLFANGKIRWQNNQKISQLCSNPLPKRLWKGAFLRMAGVSRAGFADQRTYLYKGKVVDHQVHLGTDIASTRRVAVRAANNGVVIFADYLGIYGNMVLIDHGQGIFSLYSHLSQINTVIGAKVDQQSVLGTTGTTGMAGGDHLHFSTLVNGVFVTPKEWWDKHWIEVTIEEPLVNSKF